MTLIGEILSFITKYTEVVKDIEEAKVSDQDKIKRYDDVIFKIQECESLLIQAGDKGEMIAADGSAVDKNSITAQVSSLKQQLTSLRRFVFCFFVFFSFNAWFNMSFVVANFASLCFHLQKKLNDLFKFSKNIVKVLD